MSRALHASYVTDMLDRLALCGSHGGGVYFRLKLNRDVLCLGLGDVNRLLLHLQGLKAVYRTQLDQSCSFLPGSNGQDM